MSAAGRAWLRLPLARMGRIQWRQEALYLAFVGMETALLVPWYLALRAQGALLREGEAAARAAAAGAPALAVAGEVGLGFLMLVWVARGLFALDLPLARRQGILAGLILLTWLLALRLGSGAGEPLWSLRWLGTALYEMAHATSEFPESLLTTGMVLVLWWRAISLAQRHVTLANTSFAFRVGVLILIVGVGAVSLHDPAAAPPLVVAYFYFSLLAISLARVEELAGEGGAVGSALSGRWTAILTLATGGLVALGILVGQLYSLEGLRTFLHWLAPLWRVLGDVLYFLLSLVARLLEPLMLWMIETLRKVMGGVPSGPLVAPLGTPAFGQPPSGSPSPARQWAGEVLQYGCLGGLFFLAVVLILLILPGRRTPGPQVEETRESLWPGRALLEEVAKAARRGAERLQELGDLVRQYGVGRTLFAALTVRRLYALMCQEAARRGFPRGAAQTPYEYLADLARAFPGGEREARTITEAYVQVHYGEIPASPEQWEEVQSCWRRMQALPPPTPQPSGASR
ncbi:MAG: DUF4129 domain-containing protein [Anaerolineae bacterium]